jgi:hypothetical protein
LECKSGRITNVSFGSSAVAQQFNTRPAARSHKRTSQSGISSGGTTQYGLYHLRALDWLTVLGRNEEHQDSADASIAERARYCPKAKFCLPHLEISLAYDYKKAVPEEHAQDARQHSMCL